MWQLLKHLIWQHQFRQLRLLTFHLYWGCNVFFMLAMKGKCVKLYVILMILPCLWFTWGGQLMEIDSKRTNSKSLEDQRMDLLSRFMGLRMQQKERKFEHVDKNKKQEGFSNGFLRDIVISFILVGRDTTYECVLLIFSWKTYQLVLDICFHLSYRLIMVLLVVIMQPSHWRHNTWWNHNHIKI